MQRHKQFEAKCEGLEDQSRRNNVRIYSVLGKCGGDNKVAFEERLICEKMDINCDLQIERYVTQVNCGDVSKLNDKT